jgi:hypothetical protein
MVSSLWAPILRREVGAGQTADGKTNNATMTRGSMLRPKWDDGFRSDRDRRRALAALLRLGGQARVAAIRSAVKIGDPRLEC